MRKVTLCGPASAKRGLVRGLQDLGCLHVVPLNPPGDETAATDGQPSEQDAQRALRFLRDAPYRRHQAAETPDTDLGEIVRQVLATKQRRRDLLDQREEIQAQLDALAPWGDFDLPGDDATLGGAQLWFYAVPNRHADTLARIPYAWVEAARSEGARHIVVVTRETPPADMLPVAPVRTNGTGTRALRRELAAIDSELDGLEVERIALTRHIDTIRRGLARAADAAALARTLATTHDETGLFALQAWVPLHRAGELRRRVTAQGMAVRIERPGPQDQPPTLLANAPAAQPGEDLAHFYHVPPARDWDPSGVLLASFALFFAIILSDAGYGAIVLLTAALPLGLWRRGAVGVRMRRLTAALGVASVGVGVLTGSYFGVTPPAGSLAGTLNLVDLTDYTAAMKLAVLIGVLHLALGNAAWAAAHWPRRMAIGRLGWVAATLGGFAAWLAWDAGSRPGALAALGVVGLGLLTVIVFQSDRPVRRPVDHLLRALDGLLGVASVTKLFGDVLSYLRLFALGLATALLAAAFNDIAADVRTSVSGLGVLLAGLVLVAGHGLTFVLAVVSGVVHGLRLDYIEFYGWSLSGEGYPYTPLERTEHRV
ncbi:V/A-type H+-transporting ATPase subunit I [Limimonas halophila]|uniref:V/A-type H+-transporting ATPase subunit I n=2 Tax=Limimonas halophila TaxID=1082479 RepID=A0A1G7UBD2_9PROT|nr:V/A-type H+-transporting ATPase subunit I [Limimonas halophila]